MGSIPPFGDFKHVIEKVECQSFLLAIKAIVKCAYIDFLNKVAIRRNDFGRASGDLNSRKRFKTRSNRNGWMNISEDVLRKRCQRFSFSTLFFVCLR